MAAHAVVRVQPHSCEVVCGWAARTSNRARLRSLVCDQAHAWQHLCAPMCVAMRGPIVCTSVATSVGGHTRDRWLCGVPHTLAVTHTPKHSRARVTVRMCVAPRVYTAVHSQPHTRMITHAAALLGPCGLPHDRPHTCTHMHMCGCARTDRYARVGTRSDPTHTDTCAGTRARTHICGLTFIRATTCVCGCVHAHTWAGAHVQTHL